MTSGNSFADALMGIYRTYQGRTAMMVSEFQALRYISGLLEALVMSLLRWVVCTFSRKILGIRDRFAIFDQSRYSNNG
jgi:hypothetical protein